MEGLCVELTEQPTRRLVHLVNYRGDGPIRNVAVTLQLPRGTMATSVRLASPEHQADQPLEHQSEGGVVRFTVPQSGTYEIAGVDVAVP